METAPITQRGRVIEKMIGDFSSRFFMKDFVFWDLTYVSGGKRKAHPTDLLLILNGERIVISVKGTDGVTKSPDRLKLWLKGKAWDANKSAKLESRGSRSYRTNASAGFSRYIA
jgi:hypothetical protein